MTEEHIQLYEKRKKTYPKLARGKFRNLKWLGAAVLLLVYYVTPWLRWDRGANAPDQAILISLKDRRAFFFDFEIWPQEVYYLAGLLILSAFGLFFVTSLFGRVWCGYTCPHTVFTDMFVAIERFFQGDRNARIKLDKDSWSFNKIWRKLATHIAWIMLAFSVGFGWVLYFNDAPTLLQQLLAFEMALPTTIWVVGLTFGTYLFAGFAREQVCTYMCPYARFQSAMFDDDTLIIAYDVQRGEPRGSFKKGSSWENRGHCVECMQCVVVCPQDIDIRDGLQMECIACGLCIDACNETMAKLNLPPNLIRYDTMNNQKARAEGQKERKHLLRPRTVYYSVVMMLAVAVFVYSLANRATQQITLIHDRAPLFVTLSDGGVRNGYVLKILNKQRMDAEFRLKLEGMDDAHITVQDAENSSLDSLKVAADKVGQFRLFIQGKAVKAGEPARQTIRFVITNTLTGEETVQESMFIRGKNAAEEE
jgi:cytochrome c oxidase accessory protein FixG